jgi:hypothetical protein
MANLHRDVYTIVVGTVDKKDRWVKIGASFLTKDGSESVLLLDALPVNGKLQLRTPKPKEDAGIHHA